jgi:hypothetical protein
MRTERRVIVLRDVALHAGYHDRLARPFVVVVVVVVVVDDAVHAHAFEGITVLWRATNNELSFGARATIARVFTHVGGGGIDWVFYSTFSRWSGTKGVGL